MSGHTPGALAQTQHHGWDLSRLDHPALEDREEGREGWREGGRDGGIEGGREGGREEVKRETRLS